MSFAIEKALCISLSCKLVPMVFSDPSRPQVARSNCVHKLQTGHSCHLQEVTPEKQLFHPTTETATNDELLISHYNINTQSSKQVMRGR